VSSRFERNGRIWQLTGLLLIFGGVLSAQFVPKGNAESDKRNWLLQATPQIATNRPCLGGYWISPPETCLGGVLWPTLVQVQSFLGVYGGALAPCPTATTGPLAPVCITAGSEEDHHSFSPTGTGHWDGFKVDLQIQNQRNVYLDPLSEYIVALSSPIGCRNDDNAPEYRSLAGGMVFALEHPIPVLPPCGPPLAKEATHWDVQSGYGGTSVSPTTMTLDIGQTLPSFPAATDLNGAPIPNTVAWMFNYDSPNDPGQQIAIVDWITGNITGISEGSSTFLVSAGGNCSELVSYCGAIDVQVMAQNPPGGGPACQGSDPAQWSGCWHWDPGTGGWVWYPDPTNPGGPNPPGTGDPPPGGTVCSSPAVGPCWAWDPNANNGAGEWIFVPPLPGQGGTTTTPPITPVESEDPNAIAGPAGAGVAQYISEASPSAYTIFFGNDPTATASAQQVVITDQINSAAFKLNSLVLGPITFAGQAVTPSSVPLQSAGNYSTQVTTANLIVNVTASVNASSGVLTWVFQSLDPATGLPTTDPTAGFLPPGASGSVSFSLGLQPGLATGTVVNDQGTVVFDVNPPISTSVWSNTIDVTAPVSQVAALPATELSASFTVNWSGTDVGSGIQFYTIYVSDSGGSFNPWLSQTAATSGTFIGTVGHSYSFYSVATDFAGNMEAAKTTPDTSTTIVAKAAATVTLGNLAATYDGAPKAVTATTVPANLTVAFTYNGSTTAPTTAGSYTVVGTINDPNYTGSATGILVISKATPTITWPTPAASTFGGALGVGQLNATANVPGVFVYTPPAGTVLSIGKGQTLSVAFTPSDTTDYNTATASTTITVNPAAPPPSPADLVVTKVLTRSGGNVVVQLTIANTGGTAAANVVLTSVKVGADSATPLPQSIGAIGAGASSQAAVTVPGSVGVSGAASSLTITGTYTGGTFSSSARITLP